MSEFESIVRLIALYAIPGISAITLHEAAHGYAARHFGDLTAYQAGRITLNPIRHIDPIGTILIPRGDPHRERRQICVRLGQAGAGELWPTAPSEARHAVGRRRGPGREPFDGDHLGAGDQACAGHSAATISPNL